jgi:hypothetical protein
MDTTPNTASISDEKAIAEYEARFNRLPAKTRRALLARQARKIVKTQQKALLETPVTGFVCPKCHKRFDTAIARAEHKLTHRKA